MTAKEKERLKEAITLIHVKNDYYGGMDILAQMVGYAKAGERIDRIAEEDWKRVVSSRINK